MTNDTILILILTLLTFNFFLVSTVVVLLIRDIRRVVQKVELVMDNVHDFTNMATKPVGVFLTLITGLMEGVKTYNSIKDIKNSSNRRRLNE